MIYTPIIYFYPIFCKKDANYLKLNNKYKNQIIKTISKIKVRKQTQLDVPLKLKYVSMKRL